MKTRNHYVRWFLLCAVGVIPLGFPAHALTPIERLGESMYFDHRLSSHMQSCASCHSPNAGFADPDRNSPTSAGAVRGRFGNRNSPTAAYAAFSPEFAFNSVLGRYVGGQFWDGRAKDLVEQAKGPLLNPLEMNNPSKAAVVAKVQKAMYAPLFLQVFGSGAFADVEQAYHNIATAIAAFERTTVFSPFTSKYDAYLAGQTTLTAAERNGLNLFETKGRCAECHSSAPAGDGTPPLFTNFMYENLGVPRNPNNPFYRVALEFNPDGANFVDRGLGAIVGDSRENGKFKVPTLRNIAITAPYTHNGIYGSLDQVVEFHNSKTVGGVFQAPEVAQNLNTSQVGNLGLSAAEMSDIVAFLTTLTDGYTGAGGGGHGVMSETAPAESPAVAGTDSSTDGEGGAEKQTSGAVDAWMLPALLCLWLAFGRRNRHDARA